MFTEIGIENFKSFGKMQCIPLKPITLLYGPNSSGKSSLLQALLLLKQTLEESGDEKIILLPKGNLVDLGGYEEFIHGHNVKKDFSLSISLKYSWDTMAWHDDIRHKTDPTLQFTFMQDKSGEILLSSLKTSDRLHPDPIMECQNVWHLPHLKSAILKKKSAFVRDGETPSALNEWLYNLKKSVLVMKHINMTHWFERYNWEGYAKPIYIKKGQTAKTVYSDLSNSRHKDMENDLERLRDHLKKEQDKYETEYKEMANELHRFEKGINEIDLKDDKLPIYEKACTLEGIDEKKNLLIIRKARIRQIKKIIKFMEVINESLIRESYESIQKIRNFPGSGRLISMSNCFPDEKNNLSGEESWLFQNIPEFVELGEPSIKTNDIYETLNSAHYYFHFVSSLLKDYLHRIIYIGPLREYPERVYSYSGNIPSNVGKSGKYTPDILMKRKDLVDKVNDWFKRFEIRYKLDVDSLKRNLFALILTDVRTGCAVSPKDVGFGIGQLLPILVQGALSENKILFIEQPEIHVHPRLQAELGSFIAEMAGRHKLDTAWGPAMDAEEELYGNQFIIETHSEHLILRLLKLIRDTTNGELKKGEKPLRPEDVAVIYAKPTEHGTELMELRISEDGDFIDKWPDGFFTEREKELF